jgi:uncharacterized protein YyaL (SSP411 family)
MASTARWLASAQDATPDGGVAALYSIATGWDNSYPETSGYIIPTLLAYAELTGEDEWQARAVKIAEWLLSIQLDGGGWASRSKPGYPLVFDTGQIILGFIDGYQRGWSEKYLAAAEKAAIWLVSVQEESGAWQQFTYNNQSTTYHTRVAWALLKTADATSNQKMAKSARKNLDWAVQQQAADGWFRNAAFAEGETPSLHTIAYTIRGLLESGLILQEERNLQAAEKAARKVLARQRENGSIAGEFSEVWSSSVTWCCLTGAAQMAIVWLKLYSLNRKKTYLEAANKTIDFIKTTQDLKTRNHGIQGGVWGSYPINGGYLAYALPNWAAKFFLDALTLSLPEQTQPGGFTTTTTRK